MFGFKLKVTDDDDVSRSYFGTAAKIIVVMTLLMVCTFGIFAWMESFNRSISNADDYLFKLSKANPELDVKEAIERGNVAQLRSGVPGG